MSHEPTQDTERTLGDFLSEHRKLKGVSLDEVSEITKISLPILKAIEKDEYERMPADAFCRGFYTMYAKFLELDPQEILARYQTGRGIQPKTSRKPARPPVRKSGKFTNYAEPSSISAATSITLSAVVCFLIFMGACWYFNFNPVNYISTRLIPPQPAIEGFEQSPFIPPPTDAVFELPPESDSGKVKEEVPQEALPAPASSGTNEKVIDNSQEERTKNSSAVAPYHLKIDFNSSGILKVALDDGFVLDKNFYAGESLQWNVEKKIILDMPESLSGRFTLNGIEIPLPEAVNNRRLLSLPEDLLD